MTAGSARGPRGWAVLAAGFFFILVSVAMTWPLAKDLGHLVPDAGDPYLATWILHWDWSQFFRDPIHLFDANIFHPFKLTLAFSENLFGIAIFGFPLYFAGIPPLTVYNFLLLLGIALSGFGAWALAFDRTRDAAAAVFAGVAYAFAPFRFDQLSHIHTQWGGFLPLFLIFLFRFFESRRNADLVKFAVFFVVNGLASIHFAIFGAIAFALTAALELTRRSLWRDRVTLVRLFVAFGSSLLALAPFLVPYTIAARAYHFHRGLHEMTFFSASAASFLSAGVRNKLLGTVTARFSHPEATLYPGLVLMILATIGIFRMQPRKPEPTEFRVRRRSPAWLDALIIALTVLRVVLAFHGRVKIRGVISIQETYRLSMLLFVLIVARCAVAFPRFLSYENWGDFVRRSRWPPLTIWGLLATVAGIVMALGGNFFFYRELFEIAPFVFGAIRCPGRGIVLAHLGLGLLAASALASLRKPGRPIASLCWPVLTIAAALFEYRAAPLDLYRSDAEPTGLTRWLATQNFAGGILELPMKLEDNPEYVYRVTQHDHPILNGYSGFFPRDFIDLQNRFGSSAVPPGTMDLVRMMDARLVVFHPGRATTEELSSIVPFFREQSRAGGLKPAAYFHNRRDTSLVFEIPSNAPLATSAETTDAEKRIGAFLANPGKSTIPPYGYLDRPVQNAVIRGGEIVGHGWAAAESGIDRIEISLDGKVASTATYGTPRPDVFAVLPKVPCKERCGYLFRVAKVSPGHHELTVRLIAGNSKDATLPKVEIQVRP